MTETPSIVAFLTARYDELAHMATDRLCIACGHPVKERHVTEFGIREWRGYEHDERRDSTGRMHRWQGVRCEGGMTGAEPVQRPDLVLADLAAKRALLALWQRMDEDLDSPGFHQAADELLVQLLAPYGKRAVFTRDGDSGPLSWRLEDDPGRVES